MPAAPAAHEPPHHPLPEWCDLLKAKSFADGQAKFKTYLQKAGDCIALADTDPRAVLGHQVQLRLRSVQLLGCHDPGG